MNARLAALLLAALAAAPPAAATIVSDGGFKCIFNMNGINASPAQRNTTGTLATTYDGSNLGCAAHTPVPTAGWPANIPNK